jgi:hypothetical protein
MAPLGLPSFGITSLSCLNSLTRQTIFSCKFAVEAKTPNWSDFVRLSVPSALCG